MFNNSADKVLKKRNFRIKGPLPVSDKSQPFNAAHRQYLPIDLKARGYVEEEFIINGLANVYEWFHGDNNPATIRTDAAPYTTRILVRRPRNPVQFSGNVIVEVFNWSRGYDTPWGGWAESYDYFLSHRDVWVGITIRPAAIEGLRSSILHAIANFLWPTLCPLNRDAGTREATLLPHRRKAKMGWPGTSSARWVCW